MLDKYKSDRISSPMFNDMLPFHLALNATAIFDVSGERYSHYSGDIAGTSLWSLVLYLGFSPVGDWVAEQLNRWFNFAERSLYTSAEEFERTRRARESQNSFYASVFSIIPFLIAGGLCNYGVEITLGRSWSISMGLLACVCCGLYELGRRDSHS